MAFFQHAPVQSVGGWSVDGGLDVKLQHMTMGDDDDAQIHSTQFHITTLVTPNIKPQTILY